MKTLGRNSDNDLYVEAGRLATVEGPDAQCAIIEAILQTQKGELQFDEEAGIDYFGTVLQNPNNIRFWAGLVRSKIEALSFVAAIENFTYEFDHSSGTLVWSMTVVNTDDERLDLRNRKLVIDGRPGIDVDWKDVYDRPMGVDDAVSMLDAMRDQAQGLGDASPFTEWTTLRKVKDVLNEVVYDPFDKKYAASLQVTFRFSGVPLGTVIDFSNLSLGMSGGAPYAPFRVEISDGAKNRCGDNIALEDGKWVYVDGLSADGNHVWFEDVDNTPADADRPVPTTKHTIMSRGDVEVVLTGHFKSISTFDSAKPIFLTSKGDPFRYLTGVTIGSRVPIDTIGDGCFREMSNLSSISWQTASSVDAISLGNYAFAGCAAMTGLKWIPYPIAALGEGCFSGCTSLVSLQGISESLITKVPDRCFEGCSSLQNLNHLPSSITELGDDAFRGCSSIENITPLPSGVTTLGNGCFRDCTSLGELLYPPFSLVTIGEDCFRNDTSLRCAYLPSELEVIGNGAFAGCTSLTNIMSETNIVPSIGEETFDQESLGVYVPYDKLEDYRGTIFWWKYWNAETNTGTILPFGVYRFSLEGISNGFALIADTSSIESDSIWSITYRDGDRPYRYENTTTGLPAYTYDVDGEAISPTIVIKGYIKGMAAASDSAYPFFATGMGTDFPYLKAIEMEHSPLETLGDYVFKGCTELETINLNNDDNHPYRLGKESFRGCKSLATLGWLTSGLGKVVREEKIDEDGATTTTYYPAFGDGCFRDTGITELNYANEAVTSLPPYCFAETRLASLDGIAAMVLTSLGDHCFYKCERLGESSEAPITELQNTGVKTLPDSCFEGCSAMRSIEGIVNVWTEVEEDEDTIERTGIKVFKDCASLETLEPLFSAEHFTGITDYMFAGCTALRNLGFESGDNHLPCITSRIVSLGEGSFSNCSSITNIKDLNEATSITAIPAKCFSGCENLRNLVGCEHITTIGSEAFAGCSRLLSTSGMGFSIASIGSRAFANCINLQFVSCVASSVPSLERDAFSGVNTLQLPLFVKDDMVSSFADKQNSNWGSAFQSIQSRTIRLRYDNLAAISSSDAQNTSIECATEAVVDGENIAAEYSVWYADYGDDNGVRIYYYAEAGQERSSLEPITYGTRGTRDIVVFGDIIGIGSGAEYSETTDSNPDAVSKTAFLGSLAGSATAITIDSIYLETLGDFCFFNYGRPNEELEVSITASVAINAYCFAKNAANKANGLLGELSSSGITSIGDFGFYQCGIVSSMPFSAVTALGKHSFAKNPSLASLEGFYSVKNIGAYAFKDCTAITTTSGLSSVAKIGEGAFSGCSGITTLTGFGGDLKNINGRAFEGCGNITSLFIPAIVPPVSENSGDILRQDVFEDVVYDTASLYVSYTSINDYKAKFAWSKFGSRIGSRALTFTFEGIKAGDTIPSGVCSVTASGSWTVAYGVDGGEEETSFAVDDTSKVLSTFTFDRDHARCEVIFSGPVTGIASVSQGASIFGATVGAKLVEVASSSVMEVTSFGNYSFYGCSGLVALKDIPSVVSIGDYCFANCTRLADISGISNVASVGAHAFDTCSSLKNLDGMASITSIGDSAFRTCSSLETIDGLGTAISSIGDSAFEYCSALKEVQMFAETPPALGSNVFNGIDLTNIPLYVRTKNLAEYQADSSWSVFPTITTRTLQFTLTNCSANTLVDGTYGRLNANTFWVVDWESGTSDYATGIKTNADDVTVLPSHTYTTSGTHVFRIEGAITAISSGAEIEYRTGNEHGKNPPETAQGSFVSLSVDGTPVSFETHNLARVETSGAMTLKTIGDGTFLFNRNLAAVSLDGITSIGKSAFAYTALSSTEMLSSVSTIGDYAFYGCQGVTAVTNLGSPDKGFSIGDFAFAETNGTTGHPAYIRTSVISPSQADITDSSFGYFNPEDAKRQVYIYVPLSSRGAYAQNAQWGKFTIATQVLTFTLKNVPSGTTIIGRSATDSVGTARIATNDTWMIDWDDKNIRNSMTKDETSFPEHTYQYDASNSEDRALWVSRTVNGETVFYRREIHIQISGSITSIGCQSVTDSPFLAVERGAENPYLTNIDAGQGFESIKTIGTNAFANCPNLETVQGFIGVTAIEDYAFMGCTRLVDLGTKEAENGFLACTYIGFSAFEGCSSLASLQSFPRVLTIGPRAFANCLSLSGTTGLGRDYKNIPYQNQYSGNDPFWEGNDVSDIEDINTAEWSGETTKDFTDSDLGVDVAKYGWNDIRTIVVSREGNTYTVQRVEWSASKVVSFGSYAFENVAFGLIDMDSYTKPPSIKFTTFTGDPKATLVFAPSGSEGYYQTADVWSLYYSNIIAASSISIQFAPHLFGNPTRVEQDGEVKITGGWGLDMSNSRLIFNGNALIVDWGDGTTTTSSATSSDVLGWQIPSHFYEKDLYEVAVTVTIRGAVTKLFTVDDLDGKNALPEDLMSRMPFLKVGHYYVTTQNIGNAQTTVYQFGWAPNSSELENNTPVYLEPEQVKMTKVAFGSGSSIQRIGRFCFTRSNIGQLEIGKPTNQGLEIGAYAFYKAVNLSSVTADASGAVTTIEDYAFYETSQTSLERVTASATNYFFKGTTRIGKYAFKDGIWLTDTDNLDSVTTIGEGAFLNCRGLDSIHLPSTLTSLGNRAFMGCTSVGMRGGITWDESTDPTILNNNNITIGAEAFSGCSNATNWAVRIPRQVKTISAKAFCQCGMSSFSWTRWPDGDPEAPTYSMGVSDAGTEDADYGVFSGCTSLQRVESFPEMNMLPSYSFYNCESLGNIDFIPLSVESIGRNCFKNCNLSNANLDLSQHTVLYGIGDSAFENCGLASLSFPASLMTIGSYAFRNNRSLTSLEWPISDEYDPDSETTIPSIGNSVFMNCTSLRTIESFGGVADISQYSFFRTAIDSESLGIILSHAVGTLGRYSFAGCEELGSITIPDSITNLGEGCFNCSNWLDIGDDKYLTLAAAIEADVNLVDDEESVETAEGPTEVVWNVSQDENPSIGDGCFMNCMRLQGITANVKTIGNYAFYNCLQLASFSFPDGLQTIGNYAFSYCKSVVNNQPVTVPDSVTTIGAEAFAYCTSMAYIPNMTGLTSSSLVLGKGMFKGCTALKSCEGMPSIVTLPDETFRGCSSLVTIDGLSSATINLGAYCFAECTGLVSTTTQNIYNSASNVLTLGQGCFSGCTGLSQYNGMPLVVTLPTLAFKDATNIGIITRLYSDGYTGGKQSDDPDPSPLNQAQLTSSSTIGINFTLTDLGLPSGWNITRFSIMSRRSVNNDWVYQNKNGDITLKATISRVSGTSMTTIVESEISTIVSTQPLQDFYSSFGVYSFAFDESAYGSNTLQEGITYRLSITGVNFTFGNAYTYNERTYFYGFGLALRPKETTQGPTIVVPSTTWASTRGPIWEIQMKYKGAGQLCGRAFEGCSNIGEVRIPFSYAQRPSLIPQGGSSDPFPSIPKIGTKKDAVLKVPTGEVSSYENDSYWGTFREIIELTDSELNG